MSLLQRIENLKLEHVRLENSLSEATKRDDVDSFQSTLMAIDEVELRLKATREILKYEKEQCRKRTGD